MLCIKCSIIVFVKCKIKKAPWRVVWGFGCIDMQTKENFFVLNIAYDLDGNNRKLWQ